ncbi:hypothetical protein [Glaciecola sp. KUL10]|uniref:hypothetical protein n=1 Tax=Glaciecola sp. (strain KUL10) TaxID=2161813 RepID=UPI000D78B696|nr:hypothetical protein [Glaciecola sp. KUL10]GBL05940.1 hypothetical protein KUL10_32730 [Glaciecola sp. KUL10]
MTYKRKSELIMEVDCSERVQQAHIGSRCRSFGHFALAKMPQMRALGSIACIVLRTTLQYRHDQIVQA